MYENKRRKRSRGQIRWKRRDNRILPWDKSGPKDRRPDRPRFPSQLWSKEKSCLSAATLDAAIWGAELSPGEGFGRLYVVEPTGQLKTTPISPARSFQATRPIPIGHNTRYGFVEKSKAWQGHSPERLKAMKDHLEHLKKLRIKAIED